MEQEHSAGDEMVLPPRKRRLLRKLAALLLVLVLAAVAIAWWQRKDIAQDLITDALAGRGIPATYTIESIAPGRQVLTDIVIGDPARPDLTIERAEIQLTARFGLPGVRRLSLQGARLFGTLRDGQLSFGSLDPLVFPGGDEPFEFPDLHLAVRDGRALIEGDYGPVALRLDGSGHLRGGFRGEMAAVAPALELPGCRARQATLYGTVGVDAERPQFSGPVRFARLACEDTGLSVADGAARLQVRADRNLVDFEGQADIRSGAAQLGASRLAALEGEGNFAWREGNLNTRFTLAGTGLSTGMARMARLEIDGAFRARDNFDRLELTADLEGRSVRLGEELDAALASAQEAGADTLLGPLLERARARLAAESRNSRFFATLTARRMDGRSSIAVPEARLRGASGATLLALSRASALFDGDGLPVLAGNFATGGQGLPLIAGRMQRAGDGAIELNLRMSEYAAGEARLAVPELRLRQSPAGEMQLRGRVVASGPLPGGGARNLAVPLSGTLSRGGELALWGECTQVTFDRLELSNLRFPRQRLTLCPPRGSAILRYGDRGLRIAAGAPSLRLSGTLGETPIRIASGPVGLAWPGALSARSLDVSLGPPATATRFAITDLKAQLGGREIGGSFAGTDVFLAAVPLDVLGASGRWRYAGGRLTLSEGAFTLQDRQEAARFVPLIARDAALSLVDNRIAADFVLRHPPTGRQVTRVALAHDLTDASGHADLVVEGLTFGPNFQPLDLTENARGVVANVAGTVSGTGRIDWTAQGVTSSGRFSTDSLDFAAAFGPVTGAAGTIEFTDLLGLTTAPRQRFTVASINPGIEVYEGEIAVSLTDGRVLRVEGASWPFLGGTLTMRPVTLTLGAAEERRYVLDIVGLDAARFVERMELNNIAATGVFDGAIPLVFDAQGNGRVENGRLVSRPPGGHVSYVGALSYEDLSYIANFAFAALRDLQYRHMDVTMNGPLTGEMVTQVRFDGVSQGPTAETNFITRRLAKLPIQLVVNLRAPFYRLITSVRSLYDPSAVRDPRGLGLLTDDGTVLRRRTDQDAVEEREAAAEAAAKAAAAGEPGPSDIQPPESESVP